MPDSGNPNEPHHSLRQWAKLTKENVTENVAKAMLQGVMNTSPLIDSVSTWLLAISGAIVGLAISNLDSITVHIRPIALRSGLLALAFSILMGLIQKHFSIQVLSFSAVARELEQLLSPILQQHEKEEDEISEVAERAGVELDAEIDWNRVIAEFKKSVPWYYRNSAYGSLEKGISDTVAGHRNFTTKHFHQCTAAWLQFLGLLVFVLCVVFGLRAI